MGWVSGKPSAPSQPSYSEQAERRGELERQERVPVLDMPRWTWPVTIAVWIAIPLLAWLWTR